MKLIIKRISGFLLMTLITAFLTFCAAKTNPCPKASCVVTGPATDPGLGESIAYPEPPANYIDIVGEEMTMAEAKIVSTFRDVWKKSDYSYKNISSLISVHSLKIVEGAPTQGNAALTTIATDNSELQGISFKSYAFDFNSGKNILGRLTYKGKDPEKFLSASTVEKIYWVDRKDFLNKRLFARIVFTYNDKIRYVNIPMFELS